MILEPQLPTLHKEKATAGTTTQFKAKVMLLTCLYRESSTVTFMSPSTDWSSGHYMHYV